MLIKNNDMTIDIREGMRGGKGKVIIKHILKNEDIKGGARLHARIILEENCSIGSHEHIEEEEVFYILSGNGRVYDNDKVYTVRPGDAILTRGGEKHSIENITSEPLEFIATILVYQ
jgi:mannose-6-phosphate isomerase-like protein (cupin superfamily)